MLYFFLQKNFLKSNVVKTASNIFWDKNMLFYNKYTLLSRKIFSAIQILLLFCLIFLIPSCVGVVATLDALKEAKKNQIKERLTAVFFSIQDPNQNSSTNSEISFEEENIYEINDKELEIIYEFEEILEKLEVLEPENLEKSVEDFNKLYLFKPKTPQEKDEEVLDWDLGIPSIEKEPTEEEIKQIKSEQKRKLDEFYQTMINSISSCTNEELKNIRVNALLGMDSYSILKEYIEANPNVDKEYFQKAVENLTKLRKLSIDEMKRRGIEL